MTILADYTAGTISVSANGTAVTGSGTAWQTAGFKEGDWLIANGWVNVVASIDSEAQLTLAQQWQGGALTDEPYRLRYMSDGSRASAQARELINMLGGSGNLEALGGLAGIADHVPVFTGPGTMKTVPKTELVSGADYDVQVNALIDRNAYDAQPEGFAVLVADTGDGRSAIYSRTGAAGNWTEPAYVTGPSITLDITEVDEVPYGDPPDVTLTPRLGGYDLSFNIPRGMIIEPGTTTTLGPGASATVDFVPVAGGYRLDIGLPKGDTGDIDGVTPFWVTRLSSDNDASSARTGLGAGDVSGPSGATDGHVALFDGATGKLIKSSGKSIDDIGSVDELFDGPLEKSPGEKAQARANIGISAMLSSDKVKFKTVPLLLADTTMSYTDEPGKIHVGPSDTFDAGGFRYEVAASGASDQHVTTAGGVKLYEAGFVFTHIERLARVSGSDEISFAELTHSGREGKFVWNGSDLSAEVTADTEQGVYVAPDSDPTGASGAWVRLFDGPVLAQWFAGQLQAAIDVAEYLGRDLCLGRKGDEYVITSGVTIPDDMRVFSDHSGGSGAKIDASSGNFTAITLGERVRLEGIEIEGPGNDVYNANSKGIYQAGTNNSPAAPTFVEGPYIENCYIHGFRHAGIQLRYVDGFTVKNTKIENIGYVGLGTESVKNGFVRRILVDDVSPGTSANAYGMYFSRLAGSAIVDPPSQDITVKDCEVRNVPLWHGFDTHGGVGIKFIDCITRNCKRGVFITSANIGINEGLGPKRCLVQNFQYLDPNADKNLRECAVYVGGAFNASVVADYAEDCVVDGVYAYKAGIDQAVSRGGAVIMRATKRTKMTNVHLVQPVGRGFQVSANNLDFLLDGIFVTDVSSDYVNTVAVHIDGSNNTGRINNFTFLADIYAVGATIPYRNNIGFATSSGLSNLVITLGSSRRNMMAPPTSYGTAITAYDN